MLKHSSSTASRRLIGAALTYTLIVFGNYAVWTTLPDPAFAQPDSQQEETRSLVEEYRAVMKEMNALIIYNTSLDRQIADQEEVLQDHVLTDDDLLKLVEQGRARDDAEEARRIQEFERAQENQRRLLNEARADIAREEARSDLLETTFEENESLIVRVTEQE